jgi:hypothetical protein
MSVQTIELSADGRRAGVTDAPHRRQTLPEVIDRTAITCHQTDDMATQHPVAASGSDSYATTRQTAKSASAADSVRCGRTDLAPVTFFAPSDGGCRPAIPA